MQSLDDEALGSSVQVRQLQSGLDHLVVDQAAYAVATEHQPVTGHDRHHDEVGVVAGCPFSTFNSSERWGCIAACSSLDLPVVDEGLHPGVIVCEPFQATVAVQVGAAVSDVRQTEPGAIEHRPARVVPSPPVRGRTQQVPRSCHWRGESRRPAPPAFPGRWWELDLSDGVDRNSRGKIASGCATHAVSHHEQMRARETESWLFLRISPISECVTYFSWSVI